MANAMRIYHGIICCARDEALIPAHVANVDCFLSPVHRCAYFGDGPKPTYDIPVHQVGARESYENLPVKTFCMLEHALRHTDWFGLLKTDVNASLDEIDLDACRRHHLVGYVADVPGYRTGHLERVAEQALDKPYDGPLARQWVGGPAYYVSRRLAALVVARGVWYARGHAYEDHMVSLVAEENGIVPVQGIRYKD